MDDREREALAAYAKLPTHQRKVEMSLKIIQKALAIAPAYVACSWGKDSLVLAHLMHGVDRTVPIIHIGAQHQDKLDNYIEVEFDFLDRFPSNYKRIDLGMKNATKTFNALKVQLPPMAFVGVRSEESKHRRLSISKYGAIHQYKSGGWRVFPLANWTWQDVWAYIVACELKYLASYDHDFNQPKSLSRTSVHVGRGRGAQFGRFERLKVIAPEYYKLIKNQIINL